MVKVIKQNKRGGLQSDHLSQFGGDSRVTEHLTKVEIDRSSGEWVFHVTRCIAVIIVRNDVRNVGALYVLICRQVAHYQEIVQSSEAKDGPVCQENDHQTNQ